MGPAARHPLEPLDPGEMREVARILRGAGRLREGVKVIGVTLHEPTREALRDFAAGRALEQLDLQGAFHCRNVLRNAGLGRVFPLRCTGKRPFLAHGDDGADLPQWDIGHERPLKADILEKLMLQHRIYYFFFSCQLA